MKRRSLSLNLTDEQADVFDAARFAHGDDVQKAIAALLIDWLAGVAHDPEVARLVRLRRRRGLRLVAS